MNESNATHLGKSLASHGEHDASAPIPRDGAALVESADASGLAQTVDPAQSSQTLPDVEQTRPSEASQAGRVVCARCQTSNAADDAVCVSCRSFLPANQLQRKTGIYSRQPPPPEIREKADELRAGVIADRGGLSELTTLELSYVEKLGDLDVTIRLITHDIAVNGLMTPGGNVRAVYDKLLAGLAAFDRYAQRIGTERRSRTVNPLDAVRAAVIAANQPDRSTRETSD
jgi:hypothetical protein